ncbi:inositol phosphate biosynthetic process [Sparganum proliferum]
MECDSEKFNLCHSDGGTAYKLLPANLSSYTRQIGGFNPDRKLKFKFLYGQEDSMLYKIVNLRPKGFNEVRLYEEVFSSDCPPSVLGLKKFLPAYRGLFYNPITSRFFIGMEDILKDMEHPSACDIKIGRTSYLPGDSEEKISTEKTKYLWREKIGFFITGMNVYDSETGFNAFYDISYGRCLEPSNVFEKGVCVFLGRDPRRRTLLAHAFLPHLSQLAAWFESQTQYHFCASSLLLAYDCLPEDASSASTPSSHAHTATPALKVHVRLIDFARWRHVDDGQYDTNFLYGLHRLMHYMRKAAFREPTGGQSHTASASSSNTGLTATSCSLRSFQVQQQQQPNVTRRLDGPDTGSSSSAGVGCRASFRPHSSSSSESVTFLV